jgi:hypothetical protein
MGGSPDRAREPWQRFSKLSDRPCAGIHKSEMLTTLDQEVHFGKCNVSMRVSYAFESRASTTIEHISSMLRPFRGALRRSLAWLTRNTNGGYNSGVSNDKNLVASLSRAGLRGDEELSQTEFRRGERKDHEAKM